MTDWHGSRAAAVPLRWTVSQKRPSSCEKGLGGIPSCPCHTGRDALDRSVSCRNRAAEQWYLERQSHTMRTRRITRTTPGSTPLALRKSARGESALCAKNQTAHPAVRHPWPARAVRRLSSHILRPAEDTKQQQSLRYENAGKTMNG